ncbi:MAG TPA: hypothetical protein VL096_13000, partial [Pirellulaceae bacterium]|nr:hypothetical protein [Pirellulaceae bacterium]
ATGAGLVTLGIMIVCLSPLLLAAASLLGLFSEPKDAEISVVLVDELSRFPATPTTGSSAPPQLNSPTSNRSPPLPPSSLT